MSARKGHGTVGNTSKMMKTRIMMKRCEKRGQRGKEVGMRKRKNGGTCDEEDEEKL